MRLPSSFVAPAVLLAILPLGALSLSACTSKGRNEPPNTVHIESVGKIKTLDPAYAEDEYSAVESSRTYEGLLAYHYLKRPYVLEPQLAESLPQMSADGKTYTFKIKQGVLFVDDASFKETGGKGRELVAEDFVYSFKRLADPKLSSTAWWLFDGKIEGLNEWRDEMAKAAAVDYAKPVAGLVATDRYTLQIKLKQASGLFVSFLAMPGTRVVAREAVEAYGKEFGNKAVGTGPFKLVEYSPNSRVIWEKSPTFRKELYPSEGGPGDKEVGLLEDAGKPLPLADRVVTEVHEQDAPMWLSFLSGKLDVAWIPKDNYAAVVSKDGALQGDLVSKGVKLNRYDRLDLVYYIFNMKDPILSKNKYLRQALSLAHDTNKFIDLFYNNRAFPANSVIPPGMQGWDENYRDPYKTHDLEKAKELMAKAGYSGGKGLPEMEMYSLTGSTERQMAEFDQAQFASIGVKTKLQLVSWPEYLAAKKAHKGQIYAGQGWGADYPDSENFLQLFYGKNFAPGPNVGDYLNPEYDKLYEKTLTMPDNAERSAVYRQMRDILNEDCPGIWIAHRWGFAISQKWVKGYKPHAITKKDLRYVRVDPALKK